MALSSLDPALNANTSGPTEHAWGHSDSRRADRCGESSLGSTSNPRGIGQLGIEVSERTVSRLLPRRPRPPSQTWRTFLTSDVAALVSMDFFTVPTLTGRVLFVLVLLAHHRRRIVHLAITEHPTAMWTAQQIIEAFPDDSAPRWLLRDRDTIYSDVFRRRVAAGFMMRNRSDKGFRFHCRQQV